MSQLKHRPLREDLVIRVCLETYGAVRHEGRLANLALDDPAAAAAAERGGAY